MTKMKLICPEFVQSIVQSSMRIINKWMRSIYRLVRKCKWPFFLGFFSDIVLFLILGFTFFDITNTVFIALKAYIRFNVLPHLFKDKSNVQQFQVFHR